MYYLHSSDGYTTHKMLLKWKKGFDRSMVNRHMSNIDKMNLAVLFYSWLYVNRLGYTSLAFEVNEKWIC